MLQRLKRKRGGQPGNKNAVGNQNAFKHGRYSPRIKAERWAQRQAEAAAERERFAEWSGPILQRCRDQHRRVLEEIRRERAERNLLEPGRWGPVGS